MVRDLLFLLASNNCYSCEQELNSQEQHFCLNCLSQIEHTHFHQTPIENELYYRLAGRVPLHGATSLFVFDKQGRLQKLIQALKYKDAPHLGVYLGRLLAEAIRGSAFANAIDAIVPVPLHPRKHIRRGYNQAERIARGTAEALDLPLIAKCLRRSRRTKTQTRMTGLERHKNVKGAFSLRQPPPRNPLLIDDVITTGATLEACIQALLAADQPPDSIRIASIGMARKH